jgi:hypothetical protein
VCIKINSLKTDSLVKERRPLEVAILVSDREGKNCE